MSHYSVSFAAEWAKAERVCRFLFLLMQKCFGVLLSVEDQDLLESGAELATSARSEGRAQRCCLDSG